MVPHESNTQVTPSEGVQIITSEEVQHMVPQNNINIHTASEGAFCLKKLTKRVTFADATTPEITFDKAV